MKPMLALVLSATVLWTGIVAAQRIEDARALRLRGEQVNLLRFQRGDEPAKHFPAAAKKAALDGVVIVDVMLNEAGRVLEAQVISESPRDQGFGLAALDLVKTFEYENPLKRWVLVSLTIEFLP